MKGSNIVVAPALTPGIVATPTPNTVAAPTTTMTPAPTRPQNSTPTPSPASSSPKEVWKERSINVDYKYKYSSIVQTGITKMFKANMWVEKNEVSQEVCVDESGIFANNMFLTTFSHINYLPIKNW